MDASRDARPLVAIAGGTRNIGLEIARSVLTRGGAVSLCGRDPAQAEVARRSLEGLGDFEVCVLDASDPDAVARWASGWAHFRCPVDAIVYAAVQRVHHRVEDFTPELWRSSIETSLSGAFYCTQAFLRQRVLPDAGSIIFIGGRSAHKGVPYRSSISAAKTAMVGLARGLAVELADRNIRVNVVVPGRLATEQGEWTSIGDPEMIDHYYAMSPKPEAAPLGTGYPSDIADAVHFLISEQARFITGQVLHVNGGTYF